MIEQKNNDGVERMREEMDNKLEAILGELKTKKSASTVTNPRSKMDEIQGAQPSGSKMDKSIGVRQEHEKTIDDSNFFNKQNRSQVELHSTNTLEIRV